MEFFAKIFESNASMGSIFQIGLDILILALLAGVFIFKRPRLSKKDEEVIKSFDKIIEETGTIAREFETNLAARQEMLQHITARLDQRIHEARDLCSRLELLAQTGAQRAAAPAASAGNPQPRGADQQKVLLLAKKGLAASEIAKSLNRPVGEIELILSLQRISS